MQVESVFFYYRTPFWLLSRLQEYYPWLLSLILLVIRLPVAPATSYNGFEAKCDL